MKYYKKLIGERIYLYPKGVSEEEIEKFTEWMNDFQVTDYTGKSGQIITLVGEKEWLENSARNNENRNFNIVDLNEDYRSNGYGTEAIKLLLEYGFKYLNLHSIKLDLLSINERAHKCYLKCGFKDTGKNIEEIFLNGKYYDKLHMDILENEFEGDYIITFCKLDLAVNSNGAKRNRKNYDLNYCKILVNVLIYRVYLYDII